MPENRRPTRPLAILLTLGFALTHAHADSAPTLAPGKPDPVPKVVDKQVNPTAFAGIYRLVKNRYIPFNDDYAVLRTFDATKPSSRGATPEELIASSTKTVRDPIAKGFVMERTLSLSSVEAQAMAYPLPNLAPGNYGYILGGTVARVIDKDTLILTDIQLINEDELRKVKEDAYKDEARKNANLERERERERERDRNGKNERNIPDTAEPDRRATDARFEQRTRLAEQQQRDPNFKSRVRVHGFNTESAVEKSKWAGPLRAGIKSVPTADPAGPQNSLLHLAIVGVGEEEPEKKGSGASSSSSSGWGKAPKNSAGSLPTVGSGKSTTVKKSSGKRVFEAVPVEWFTKGITDEQFKDLIAKRGMTQQEVVELGQRELRKNPELAVEKIIDALEKAKKDEEGGK